MRESETVESAFHPFLARQARRLKPRSYAEVERHLLIQAKPLHRLSWRRLTATIPRLLVEIGESLDHVRPMGYLRSSLVFRLGDARGAGRRPIPSATQTA